MLSGESDLSIVLQLDAAKGVDADWTWVGRGERPLHCPAAERGQRGEADSVWVIRENDLSIVMQLDAGERVRLTWLGLPREGDLSIVLGEDADWV